MTITHVQSTGTFADNVTSVALAYGSNITTADLLKIGVSAYKPSNDAFVVGDISKSAGTATLDSFTLDRGHNQNPAGSDYNNVAIYSALVTGTGSCTITVGGAPAGSYFLIAVAEFSTSLTWDATRLEAVNSADSSSGAPDSGNVTSADDALFFGALGVYTGSATTVTPDGAFTEIYESQSAAHQIGSFIYRIVTTGTTDAASWTAPTVDDWAAAVTVDKEAAASGRTTKNTDPRPLGVFAGISRRVSNTP